MNPPDDAVLRDQRAYYDARASEYDDGYQRIRAHDRGAESNTSWFAEMDAVVDAFERVARRGDMSGDVLELAAGTGVWTERLVGRARSLTVLDASAAMLVANRQRLGGTAARVDYRIVDLFEWRPERQWDACVFGFWLCKVPDDRVAAFLSVVADVLRPGGTVVCVDKTAVGEPATELDERMLNDGRQFTIIDHPRPPARLLELFDAAGLGVNVETFGGRFSFVTGTRR